MSSPRGRRPKLTPHVHERFFSAIRVGCSRTTAAAIAGIGASTVSRWMRDPRPEYQAFRNDLEQAEALVEAHVTANLFALTRRSSRAAIYFLEHRYPADWSPRARLEAPEPETPAQATRDVDRRDYLMLTDPALIKSLRFVTQPEGVVPTVTGQHRREPRRSAAR